jgi:hypothetical protein
MKLPRLKRLQKVQEFVNESKQTLPEFVVCINNVDYPASLELHKIYRVLIDEDATSEGDIRIIDESGEDYNCEFEVYGVENLTADSLVDSASNFTPIKEDLLLRKK